MKRSDEAERVWRSGAVYTPRPLAALVAEAAVHWCRPGPAAPFRVLDPAVGEGVFLEELRRHLGGDAGPGEVVLHGIDRDADAIATARRLIGDASAEGSPAARRCRLQLDVADFLRFDAPHRYDLILGNPPFVRAARLDDETRRSLRLGGFALMRGDCDLYVAFFEKAVRLLRPGGVLAFITSDKFAAREYGRPLRAFLLRECGALRIADISRLPGLFPASVYPLISIWQKLDRQGPAEAGSPTDLPFAECRSISEVPAALAGPVTATISARDWLAGRPRPGTAVPAPRLSGCRRLGDVSGLELFCGTPRAARFTEWKRFLRTGPDHGPDELPLLTCGQVSPFRIHRDRIVRVLGTTAAAPRLAKPVGHISPNHWDRFLRAPKVVLRATDRRISAAVDESGTALIGLYGLFSNEDPHVLCALLNSPVCTAHLRIIGRSLRVAGGYYSLSASVFRDLPIPEVPADLAKAMAIWARRAAAGDDCAAEGQRLCAEAFGLTEAEFEAAGAERA